MPKIAIVQQAPVFLDKVRTIRKAVDSVRKAAAEGAELVIFTEAFIAGYPAWIWRLRPGGDWGLSEEMHALLLNSAVNLASEDLTPLRDAARQYHTTIVRGMNEIDLDLVCTSKRALDIAGHYSRPDIFKLQVNNERQSPIEFSK
ncbi:MAG: hypothetical protein JKY87_06445 [Mariprofundus sp.]|nr:hypothetical protein [Mariprofundus sp.]